MKLIQCTVRGFGKIKNQTFTFTDGLQTFCRENGWGKTTLTAFLKAMLYGLAPSRGDNLSENERKHFLPWDNGNCGGTLIFEADGRCYRIERAFFAKTTGSDDTCTVYDESTGAVVPWQRSVGEMLFGIDADAFERTVFLSERSLGGRCQNVTVKAKLADLVGTDADMGDLKTVMQAMDTRRRELYVNRKGSSAQINTLDRDIRQKASSLEEVTHNIDNLKAQITATDTAREEAALQTAYDALRKEANGLRTPEDGLLLKDACHKADAQLREAQTAYTDAREAFGEDVPGEDAIRQTRQAFMRCADTDAAYARDAAEAEALRHFFARPTDKDELDGMSRRLHKRPPSLLPTVLCAISAGLCAALGIWFHPLCFLGVFVALCLGISACTLYIKGKKEQVTLSDFLGKYPTLNHEPAAAFSEIYSNFAKLCLQKEHIFAEKEQENRQNDDVQENRNIVRSFAAAYGCNITDITVFDALLSARHRLDAAEQVLALAKEHRQAAYSRMQAFEKTLDPQRRQALEQQMQQIQTQLSELYQAKTRDALVRQTLKQACDTRDRLTAETEQLLAKKEAYREEHDTLVKAMSYLEKASMQLTARYTQPTKTAFVKYANMLLGTDSTGQFSMTTEFELSKEEGGVRKPIEAFSRGTRDLHAFALRLALVDALFTKEAPFLILDDPFVALDDTHLSSALSMLKHLSRDRQILYFTCSESRMPI